MPRLLFIFLALTTIHDCLSQSSDRFYNITRRDGLASGSITAIVQDQQGLIWIGTKKGLNRYDGSEFIHYHTGNSNIASNDISTLVVGDSNQLWIGTFGNGLHKMNLATNKIEQVNLEHIGGKINAIFYENEAVLWVLSEIGLARIASDQFAIPTDLSLAIHHRGSTIAKIDSSIWVGTTNGELYQLKKGDKYLLFSLSDYAANIFIQKIHPLEGDKLLLGTRQHGLLTFDTKTKSIERVKIQAIDIRDIISDKNGALWVGTDGHGIYRIKGNEIVNYLNQSTRLNSLVSNAVQVCFEDKDHNLWFGTAWDGISFMDDQSDAVQFYYSDFKGVARSGVLNIYKEKDNLWLGTDGSGLSIQKSKEVQNDVLKRIPSNAYVQYVNKFNESYWIGTFQSGFYIIENMPNGKKIHHTTESGLSHDDVRKIIPIDDKRYLIATWGGGLNIYHLDKNEFEKLPSTENYPRDVVTLHRLNQIEVLVGTFGQGVFILNLINQKFKRILPDIQNVVSIGENQNAVWFGTWGEGLHHSQPPFSKSSRVSSEVLDANANVVAVLPSRSSREIWLATTEKILRISKENGIEEMPFPTQQYHLNSGLEDNGRYYFGGTDGVISFEPEGVSETTPKPIELLEIRVLNETLSELATGSSENVLREFTYDQNMITFSFATPTYPTSRDESYELRLDPIQKDWVNIGKQRSMIYADLSPGVYVFKARNATSKLETSFHFQVLRPWWKTWWSYGLMSLFFLGLLYSFRRYAVKLERMKSQLKIEKIGHEKDLEIGNIKQKFFVNVSHEIRTPLTLIIGEIEQLALKVGSSKSISNSLTNLRNNGHYLIQLVNELLDFRKLDQGGIRLKIAEGDFVVFCREIFLSFLNKAEAQSIDYEFVCNEATISLWYDRDQLEKVFFNLLSNAFKNTPEGGAIRFVIEQGMDEVKVLVEDTGQGISEKDLKEVFRRFYQKEDDPNVMRSGYGIGLSIVQEVTILHKGQIKAESKEKQGSRFTVRLKKGKEHFNEEELIPEFINSEAIEGYQNLSPATIEPEEKTDKDAQVLVVEDNVDIRHFLIKVLSSKFNVLDASGGKEAYSMIQDQIPDIVVSDVMMPEMDGITLTRKLKKNPVTSHIPIILLTARTATVFKKEGFETGADDYITKPFSPTLLIARIENILKAKENLRQQIRNELASKPNDLNLTSPDEQFLKDLVEIVQKHLDNSELNADLIASEMGMSHSVVYKKVKALTGFNLVEFVRDYRLQQAGQMLKKYKFSVAEACYKVGFSDKKYFSQIFKKKYGTTPSEYAKGS